MIRTATDASLAHILHVAQNICPAERETYYEMSGQEYHAERVAAQLAQLGGVSWTFWETVGNFPAAVGGYVQRLPGYWESWFIATPYAWEERGREMTQAVAGVIQSMMASGARRLETTTLADLATVRAWYERIGLSYESIARKASASGLDLVTYVALRP